VCVCVYVRSKVYENMQSHMVRRLLYKHHIFLHRIFEEMVN